MQNLEVRMKFLPRVKLEQMLTKFDFERMLCVWGEMLKNLKNCSPISGFQMFVKLSFRLFRQLEIRGEKKTVPNEITVLRAILSLLRNGFRAIKRIEEFDVEIELRDPLKYSGFMYYLYISAFLPLEFWCVFTAKTKAYLLEMLQEFLTNAHFAEAENQNF
jgi:hypothetical protein